ncbi:hypothetical protein PUN28_019249 [Cardiocondyla obscurior]|uniref:Uncharacterized protein n=1 Tax=Cardiocondyla obscurior TaxID=286306 RepID=A0AAW2ECL1_9HYME
MLQKHAICYHGFLIEEIRFLFLSPQETQCTNGIIETHYPAFFSAINAPDHVIQRGLDKFCEFMSICVLNCARSPIGNPLFSLVIFVFYYAKLKKKKNLSITINPFLAITF